MGCQGSKSTALKSQQGGSNENNKQSPSVGFVMGNGQIESLKQAFRDVDVNNDNSLNLDELRSVFQKQGGLSEKDIQQFLNDADQNGNQRVEFDEFVALVTAKVEQTIKDLRIIFNSFDSDRSGALTKKELIDLLKVLEVDSTGSQMEKAFKKIDENNDGKITFEEFVSMAMEM